MSERCVIVIPARYASTRLPGKPLADIGGKPMIQHVVERARQVPDMDAVVVATDDERIADAVREFGGDVFMTSVDHPSGTDRIVEIMNNFTADIYINLQCDEPMVSPSDLACLVSGMLADASVDVGTLCHKIEAVDAENPNTVKVVRSGNGDALYFSRSPIPYARTRDVARYLRHVGIYAYRRRVLAGYGALSQPMEEQAEMLEQLRLLHAGVRIRVWEVPPTHPGVDTPECLEKVRKLIESSV